MALTDDHIKEISGLLDCGLVCYFHRLTATIESYPDPNYSYFDQEPWQEVINKIKNNW